MHTMVKRLIPLLAVALVSSTAGAQDKPHARTSWTSDRRDFVEGDIITVMIDETTLATAKKGQTGSDTQSRNNDLSLSPPGAVTSMDVSLGANKTSSSDQQGTATRNLSFKGEMTVRVMKVSPSGVLEIKGARTVDADKNKQQITLTGYVRPEDVTKANTVASARIADAQMLYTLSGDIGGTRGGIIGRLVSVFWP